MPLSAVAVEQKSTYFRPSSYNKHPVRKSYKPLRLCIYVANLTSQRRGAISSTSPIGGLAYTLGAFLIATKLRSWNGYAGISQSLSRTSQKCLIDVPQLQN
jgi:hypothetical protein